MVTPTRSGRSRFTLFILLLLSATLLTLDARNFGPVEQLKVGLAAVVSPFRSLGDRVFGPVGDAWTGLGENDELRAENERLRAELDEIRGKIVADTGAAEELEALKGALDLVESVAFDTLIAEVVAGSISNFDALVLELNRGSLDGLRDGMPVVTAGGLVGRIEDTGLRSARVRLITDASVSVGVQVVGTDVVGLITGQGEDEPLVVGKGTIRVGAQVVVGDVIMTSGSDRSLYPPGLAVGTVIDIEVDEGTLEKRLFVQPSASVGRLRFVIVVLFDPNAEQSSVNDDAAADGGG